MNNINKTILKTMETITLNNDANGIIDDLCYSFEIEEKDIIFNRVIIENNNEIKSSVSITITLTNYETNKKETYILKKDNDIYREKNPHYIIKKLEVGSKWGDDELTISKGALIRKMAKDKRLINHQGVKDIQNWINCNIKDAIRNIMENNHMIIETHKKVVEEVFKVANDIIEKEKLKRSTNNE